MHSIILKIIANKTRIASVVPAIGAELFKADCGFIPGPQLGLAALAIYNALSAVPDTDCIVEIQAMLGYMERAIANVHRLNNDKKIHHITHTPSEMLVTVCALNWMEVNDGCIVLKDKWVKFITQLTCSPLINTPRC